MLNGAVSDRVAEPTRRGRRTPGWAVLGLLVALAVAGPLVALPLSFLGGVGPTTLALLPPTLGRSVLLGVGVVASSKNVPTAVALMEWLTSPPAQQEIIAGSEFAANPAVPPPGWLPSWADVKEDPIDGERAGPLLADAVALMLEVGWN